MNTFKPRIWYDPDTNQVSTYTQVKILATELSFWHRLVYAFWYVLRPNHEDMSVMVTIRIEEAPPPVGANVVQGIRVLPPNYDYNA